MPYQAEGSSTIAPPPGFNNEQKVDHLALILEVSCSSDVLVQTYSGSAHQLYTRAYDLFKAYTPKEAHGHGRLTLWIAYRIAQTYYESGKFDLAVRCVVTTLAVNIVLHSTDAKCPNLISSRGSRKRIAASNGTRCCAPFCPHGTRVRNRWVIWS